MRISRTAALVSGGALMLAVGLAKAETGPKRQFEIPAKPLLTALTDFTTVTGVHVVRPGGARLTGRSRPVSGAHDAEGALRAMLAGTGLSYEFTDAKTVVLRSIFDEAQPVQLASEGATQLQDLWVVGQQASDADFTPGAFTITAADIARKNPTDLQDLFAGEPGVQVGSPVPISQKVYVRGVEESNLAVSIDGSAQNNKVFHHNATTYIDPGLLKQVRVDPGVAPADAGFGALAGSIAYETKDVADLLGRDGDGYGAEVKGWFNSNGGVFGNSVTGYGKQNGFEALGYFNWADGGRYRNGHGDKVAGTATHLLSGLGKLAYEAPDGHRFEVSHERVHDDAVRPFRPNLGSVGRPGEPPTRDFRLDRQNTVFNYTDTSPEGWWNPKVVLGYSATKVKVPTFVRNPGSGAFEEAYDSSGKTSSLNGKAENKFTFALGDVTAGVDFRHDRARYWDTNYSAREKMTNVGLYAQARLEPIERARLSFGGRVDHQRFEGTNDGDGAEKNHTGVSANVTGEYDLIKDLLTAKAGYSHVWAGIPLAENFILNPAWIYRNADGKLRATTSDNYSAGLVLKRNGFSLEGNVFRTKIQNARNAKFSNAYDYDFGAPGYGPVPGATWAPDLATRGFELGAGYEWETGFVRVKYAHIDVDINGRRGDSDAGNYIATPVGDIITITAAHTFVDWNVTIGGDIEIAPKYDRVGRDAVTGVRYPSYAAYEVVNAFVEYKPQLKYETTLRLDVKNILDENYSSRATYGSEFGNVTPLYEPGRSVLLTAAVKF
ncbi:TonB-dependent receptor [Hansschlegelia beijingensis]|uniref:Hemoglobin/transferrin/lactoferrin receptor protein n=1 Tax=Hansschlegelia beijingensis TaxID=1133344 RepID=A0A7W6GEA2_9HYPH|nr:TonB-dependent receptor [Hansschlegelia beijingensis]MBB3972676.1 hemoglobin/transferrin/lactoferrin receptor protein [Hansschlegelia beijingensis]